MLLIFIAIAVKLVEFLVRLCILLELAVDRVEQLFWFALKTLGLVYRIKGIMFVALHARQSRNDDELESDHNRPEQVSDRFFFFTVIRNKKETKRLKEAKEDMSYTLKTGRESIRTR